MHAYIYSGAVKSVRMERIHAETAKLAVSPFDTVVLDRDPDSETIGIGHIRSFRERLFLLPGNSPYTAGIIPDADLMTVEAQNALLKVLEEPPPHVLLFLESDFPEKLVSTVLSRCAHVAVPPEAAENGSGVAETIDFTRILAMRRGEVLQYVADIAPDRAAAKNWNTRALRELHAVLLSSVLKNSHTVSHRRLSALIRGLMRASGELSVNVNPKLVLDHAFLSCI